MMQAPTNSTKCMARATVRGCIQVSDEKRAPWLFLRVFVGDGKLPTQSYGDYNKPLKRIRIPIEQPGSNWKVRPVIFGGSSADDMLFC